ncbi:MAG: hypothetical protein KY391_01510 [Actinobacteria bacterium]|nr:hypothetical protein [Actinomycetota bacterium]
MAVDDRTGARQHLREIEDRLRPDAARAYAVAELGDMFRTGRTPDPLPNGMFRGHLVTASISGLLDPFALRIARMWMPWLGKSFDANEMRGVNVLKPAARGAMRILWPNYAPERELADRIEAFPFRTRVAPGELDPGVDVLKIDYDFDANPHLVRRILDELVQIDDGLYLGKILFRRQGSWSAIGYFTLERHAADD